MILLQFLPLCNLGLSHGATLHVTMNHMSCELEEVVYYLLKIKAISSLPELLLC
jgi:hypothetical protein